MKNFTPGFELKPFGLRFQLPTSESTSRLHQTSLVSKDEGFINRKTHKFMSKQILNISVFKQTFLRVLSNKAMSKESSGALVDCRLAVKIKKNGQTARQTLKNWTGSTNTAKRARPLPESARTNAKIGLRKRAHREEAKERGGRKRRRESHASEGEKLSAELKPAQP